MTLEASVVRLSDIIAYIGRDIEDAIIVGSIKREEIPEEITKILGNTNTQIVNKLIMDVIECSIDKPYLKFSDEVFKSLINLKTWNYEKIYSSKEALKNREVLEKAFNDLYYFYLDEIENSRNTKETIYEFIDNRTNEYKQNTDIKRVVIDYISGQTDKFFLKECKKHLPDFKI